MKTRLLSILCILLMSIQISTAQERRPIDSKHPLWFIHVDVWYEADPQKIIDLIPEDLRPYVCLNLSLSSSHDEKTSVFRKPQYAFQTLKSWATVCQLNEMWFSCQFSSGGYVHVPDDDMATYEYFFKQFPNFLGWNFAEQFWGFDEPDKASASSEGRWELFARLVEMSHKYGGFLTISWCGQGYHYNTNPIAELKRCPQFLRVCQKYPEAILFLYKYTAGGDYYCAESTCFGPFISGLTKNYGVRYDTCGWDDALSTLYGEGHGMSVPGAAGIGTVMEQTCINGATVWDGPELTWQECFHELEGTTIDGYQQRNWEHLPNLDGVWIDVFRQILNGTMYIPTREEVVGETKVVVVNDVNTGIEEEMYATWPDLYDGLYRQDDPMNVNTWLGDNFCYFKSTGRYRAIPMVTDLYDDLARQIPVQVKSSEHERVWPTIEKKQQDFNAQYPEVSVGDLYVNRYRNQLVTYTPYTYLNVKTTAEAVIPLQYNTCETLELHYDKLSSGIIREYVDHIDFYLNNFRADSTELRTDIITIKGASAKPTFTTTTHEMGTTVVAEAQLSEVYVDGTYSLTVKHCGPVSLTINCTGTANHNNIQQTAIPEHPTELPKQPVLYRGSIIIEAEDMDFRSINRCVTNYYNDYPNVRGHSGNGFMDMGNDSNGSLRHYLNLKDGQQGDYYIIMRYTCATKSGNVTITVNGKQQTVHCEQTSENEWCTVSIDATLTTGRNTLFINNNDGLPMYIDQVIYQPADIAPMKYCITVRDAEGGIVSANRSDAVEGDTITLTIQPAVDYRLDELRVVNSVFYLDDKTLPFDTQHEVTFVMPHDNVTIQPVFKNLPVFSDVVTNYRLNLTDVVTSMPEGWRCVQEDGVVHEYDAEEYSLGARVMEGFTGYQGRALYWRNNRAEYGRQEQYPLMLQKGRYELSFAMAAWKENPQYKVSVLSLETGAVVASSETFTAAPNAEGSLVADVSGTEFRKLFFDIKHQGKYVICFTDETAEDGFHEFLLLECCLRLATPDLTTDMYHEWDGCTATSQVVNKDCGGQVCVGEKLQPGSLVYGNASVFYTHYADLSDYDQLAIVGKPNLQLRILMNRLEVGNGGGDDNGGAWIELDPVIASDGMVVIDLSKYEFVHLNAIKLGWGSPEGAVKSLSLIKGKFEQPVTIIANNFTRTYGDETPELTFSSDGAMLDGTPKLSTTATKTSPVGTYPIKVEQGTVTNTKVTYIDGTLTITQAPLTVGVQEVTITEGDAIPSFTLTYSGFRNGDTESNAFSTRPTATTTATSSSKPGTYPITISGGDAKNYALTYTQGTLTIKEKEQEPIADGTYSLTLDMFHEWDGCTATSKVVNRDCGGEIHVGETLNAGNLVYGGSSVFYTQYADLTEYNTLVIIGTPGMEFRVLLNRLEVGNGGGDDNGGSWTELNPVIGKDGKAVIDLSDYDYVHLNAIKTGWGSPEGVVESLSIVRGKTEQPVTIIANDLTMTYGDEVPKLTYTTEGEDLNGTPKLSTTATKNSPVGTYPIKVEQGTVTNEKVTYVEGTLTITQAPLTVGVRDVTITEGEDVPTFTLTYSGFRNNDYANRAFTRKPTATTTATSSSKPGTYPITVSGGEAKNYALTYTQGTLTIEPAVGIERVYVDGQGKVVIYNVNGQKLSKPRKGINIIGGKKIVVK